LKAADPAKISRNQANARKAYHTALRFMRKMSFATLDSVGLQDKIEQLRPELQQLGEPV